MIMLPFHVQSLSDEQLDQLHLEVFRERNRRAGTKALDMPAPSNTEIDLINMGSWIEAVRHYRTRTGCNLTEAKCVIDRYR